MRRLLPVLFLLTAIGCVSQGGPATQPGTPAYVTNIANAVRTHVAVATAVFIETDPGDGTTQKDRATKVKTEAARVRADVASGVPVARIKQLLLEQVLVNQPPAVRVFANVILTEIWMGIGLKPNAEVPIPLLAPAQAIILAACDGAENTADQYLTVN